MTGAASAATGSDTAGLGLSTCADFGKEYSRNPDVAEAMFFNWLQGCLSGLNAILKMNDQARRDLGGMTPDEKKQFIRRFCNEHPLDYYIMGAKLLFEKLPAFEADRAKPLTTVVPKVQ